MSGDQFDGDLRPMAILCGDRHPVWIEAYVNYFRSDELSIVVAADGVEAVHLADRLQPGLVALEADSLGTTIFDVCRQVRRVTNAHLTVCCGRYDEKIVVSGLKAGADDVIGWPRSSRELAARMRAALRRHTATGPPHSSPSVPAQRLECGSLIIDINRREVRLRSQRIELTRTQFDLLVELAKKPGSVMARHELVAAVWGPRWNGKFDTVGVHIGQLRRKLGDNLEHPELLVSVRGVGYQLLRAAA